MASEYQRRLEASKCRSLELLPLRIAIYHFEAPLPLPLRKRWRPALELQRVARQGLKPRKQALGPKEHAKARECGAVMKMYMIMLVIAKSGTKRRMRMCKCPASPR